MYEEDNIAFSCINRQNDLFLNTLFEQKPENIPFYCDDRCASTKQSGNQLLNGPNQSFQECFSLRLLEMEQKNHLLPQKPFHQQEQSILLRNLNRKQEEYITQLSQKQFKPNRVAYQEQTRAIKIQRYKQKKARRKWDKKVSYDCRKLVADSRQRINGRFVKKSPFVSPIEPIHKNSLATGQIQISKETYKHSKQFQVEELLLS